MKTFVRSRAIRKFIVSALLVLMITWTINVSATSFNSPNVDGTINIASDDWDADENMGGSGGTSGRNLYVTWDSANLYVGVTGASTGSVDILIDTASGGQQGSVAPAAYSVASGSGGYEFLWRINNAGTASWNIGTGANWVIGTPPALDTFSRATDLEVRIPFSSLTGYTPGNPLNVLVLSGANPNSIQYYWPNVTGNSITPSVSFTQAFLFANAGSDGITPNNSPTAVSLQSFSANSANHWLAFSGLLILLGGSGLALLRRRQPRA